MTSKTTTAAVRTPEWVSRYRSGLVVSDALALFLAGWFTAILRYGNVWTGASNQVPYVFLIALIAPLWPVIIAVSRGYDERVLGSGNDEFRRVAMAGGRLLVALAVLSYASQVEVGRSLLLLGVPAAVGATMAGRLIARSYLVRQRSRGLCGRRVLLVGQDDEVARLIDSMQRNPAVGMVPSAVCLPDPSLMDEVKGVKVYGDPTVAAPTAAALEVDTIIVAGDGTVSADGVRRLGWSLEGTGISLFVAPSLTELATPRVTVHPLDDMVLLHIAAPVMSGPRRVAKGVFDRALAAILLLAASPIMVPVALAVRATSPGPVIFRQIRVGRDGHEFTCLKFRSMFQDAEKRRADLDTSNELDGPLFKMRNDPRVTRVGQFIRRYSIDELPQLINVLRGEMSLVGPRPPLPSEVATYEQEVHRRLLVKPGLTGLWQVSGRADLPWEQAVRLDLHYVANWTPTMDLLILARTVRVVVAGSGAY